MGRKDWIFFGFVLFAPVLLMGKNSETEPESVKKDTVTALVIDTHHPFFSSSADASGSEIMWLIDSLLNCKAIPRELLVKLNGFIDNYFSPEDMEVALSGFYGDSEFPSDVFYKEWDTQVVHPSFQSDELEDSVQLVLCDTANFCHFVMPFSGVVTSHFGWRSGRQHAGMDIDLNVKDPVVAAFDGMVRFAKSYQGYGRVVVIRHYNGLETLYAHLHRIHVKPGDIVQAGQVIGLGGSSGNSTGSHLHLEIRYKGQALNPRHVINIEDFTLYSDTLMLYKTKWQYAAVPSTISHHTVKRGDNLYEIAKQYGTSIQKICALNGISRNTRLVVGKKLLIKG